MKNKNDEDYLLQMKLIFASHIFSTKRTFYVRKRDITCSMCIKHPFEFCADIK